MLKAKPPKQAKPSKPKILISGPPGVGKTWGVLDFPAVYYIDCEGGANLPRYTDKLTASGGVYLGPEDGANDMNVVVGEIIALSTQKHGYRTLAIDSFSKLFNTAIQIEYDRMVEAKRDMDKTFGAEKKPAIAGTRRMIRWFEKLDMNVILVCHEKDEWKDGKVVRTSFDGWDKLEYELHLYLQISKQGSGRKAKVCKSRLEQFKDGEVFDWGYLPFAAKYGQDVMEAEAVAVDPATADQISRITKLVEVVRLDDETRIKWFERAGVENWSEMDSDTIQKCIDFLTKTAAA